MAVVAHYNGIQAYFQLKKIRMETYHVPEHTEEVQVTDQNGTPLINPDGSPVMEIQIVPHQKYKKGAACVYIYLDQQHAYNNSPIKYNGSIEFDYEDEIPIADQAYQALKEQLGDDYIEDA